MNLTLFESIIQRLGGLLAFSALGFVLYGVWRGTQRQVGRTTGKTGKFLRSFWLYLASSAFFFGIAYLGWIPLPFTAPPQTRMWILLLGSLLFFPGMTLALWGRLTLGKNYFVSTGFGVQLFAEHQLITSGPFAIVRHPMYAGLMLVAIGALLIYTTWTTVFFACFAPLLGVRAQNEERALAAEFGEQWREYCKRVPMFVPRFRIERGENK
jgi:protein-S-isoprenylcysteine O-methyltransferase Ste14